MRTVARRQHDDVAAGRINVEPGERVVEIVHEPAIPNTLAGWERMLNGLIRQARDNQIRAMDVRRLSYLAHAAGDAVEPPKPVETQPPAPPPDPVRAVVEDAMRDQPQSPSAPPAGAKSSGSRHRKNRKRRKR